MAYSAKTNWQNNEIVNPADMNRIEQGIKDANDKGESTDSRLQDIEELIGQITLQKSENKVTVFNANGSITETIKNGTTTLRTKTTTFPSTTQIIETTIENGVTTTKTTTFNADGTIKEEVI